jgi:hypothetical protein
MFYLFIDHSSEKSIGFPRGAVTAWRLFGPFDAYRSSYGMLSFITVSLVTRAPNLKVFDLEAMDAAERIMRFESVHSLEKLKSA